MATESLQTQLERVQAKIAEIEAAGLHGVQRLAVQGDEHQFPDLEALYERERWLKRELARETRGRRAWRGVPT